jgi:hypothetical protein
LVDGIRPAWVSQATSRGAPVCVLL